MYKLYILNILSHHHHHKIPTLCVCLAMVDLLLRNPMLCVCAWQWLKTKIIIIIIINTHPLCVCERACMCPYIHYGAKLCLVCGLILKLCLARFFSLLFFIIIIIIIGYFPHAHILLRLYLVR